MRRKQVTVLFAIDLPAELQKYLEQQLADLPGVKAHFAGAPEQEKALLDLAPAADVIVGWRIPPGALEAATRMQLLVFPGVGVQRLVEPLRELNRQRDEAGESPITLVKCVSNTYATAQHAVALLLALMNKLVLHHNWMREGLWRRGDSHAESLPLRKRRIGLLGYGQVNEKVHRFLAGYDVKFSILKRRWGKDPRWLPTVAERYDERQLPQFLDEIDVLFVAVPETSRTRGMIGTEQFKRLGPQGLLINVARGNIVDEGGLYRALKEGRIAGAALDVWYQYRPEPDTQGRTYPYDPRHPFHELDNVVLSPHRAASPVFAPYRWDEVVEHIARFLNGEDSLHAVDLDAEY